MSEFENIMATNENMKPFSDLVESIMSVPEEALVPESREVIVGIVNGALTENVREMSIQNIVQDFTARHLGYDSAVFEIENMKATFANLIEELKPSENRRALLNEVFAIFTGIFDTALQRYHHNDIVLPMTLEEGAKVPTYAKEGDAAADLYAKTDMTLAAHSLSNKVGTGLRIQLPEGWAAYILPRSSIGAKTGLRLSNSQGVIDNGYTGELIVLYDNISDSEYTIHAGDRIAQFYIAPIHRFTASVVETLEATDRGEGGFGSTGK